MSVHLVCGCYIQQGITFYDSLHNKVVIFSSEGHSFVCRFNKHYTHPSNINDSRRELIMELDSNQACDWVQEK